MLLTASEFLNKYIVPKCLLSQKLFLVVSSLLVNDTQGLVGWSYGASSLSCIIVARWSRRCCFHINLVFLIFQSYKLQSLWMQLLNTFNPPLRISAP